MIYGEKDSFNAAARHDVLISSEDAGRLDLKDGDDIVVHNRHGLFHGYAKLAPVASGNIELYWPESNMLFKRGVYEPHAGIPEYNASVQIERADRYYALKDTQYAEKTVEELDMEPPA